MWFLNSLAFLVLCIHLFGCASNDNGSPTDGQTPSDSLETPVDSGDYSSLFIDVKGTDVVDTAGNPILLTGVAFGNEVWYNSGIPEFHHQKSDYANVKSLGMNFIRFYLNTESFEDYSNPYTYKEEGWAWLDSNIAWAKEYGVHLNLNVHVPQGGFQSNGDGGALWDNPENASRFKAFWYNLAARYKDETIIASYDLLNEPGPTQSKQQWADLAQQIIDTIRTVDSNHIVIVERVNSVAGAYALDSELNFVDVVDPAQKLVYQFHFYEPIEYTHQLTSWTGMGDGGKYPDASLIGAVDADWAGEKSLIELDTGDSDWELLRSAAYKVDNEKYMLAKPAFQSSGVDTGSVYLDHYYVIELDSNGDSIGTVVNYNSEDNPGMYYWSEDNSGELTMVNDSVNGGTKVLKLTGSVSWANASSNTQRFKITHGNSYQIVAWLKGEGIPEISRVGMKLDFEKTEQELQGRTKEFLENQVAKYVDYIHAKGVPAYLGEFGVYKVCFEDGKGGQQWVTDMLDILAEQNVSWTYHTYHEDAFGLYYDNAKFPTEDDANTELIELFRVKLN